MNEPLRRALAASRLTDTDVAARLGVDPKTVRRWIAGTRPYPRHRWALADLVEVPEYQLWPGTEPTEEPPPQLPPGLRAVYPHRWQIPRETWHAFFESAEHEIGILVYSGFFLADDPGMLKIFERKARAGVKVRILLGDPDCPNVKQRGIEEGIGDALAAKIRNALALYLPLTDVEGIQIRLHQTVLYNSIYRADEHLLVNHHVYGFPAANAPVSHINSKSSPELADIYLTSFSCIWGISKNPLPANP
ncbi:DUF5919 domain-containing protein [Marinactinospora endophytica]